MFKHRQTIVLIFDLVCKSNIMCSLLRCLHLLASQQPVYSSSLWCQLHLFNLLDYCSAGCALFPEATMPILQNAVNTTAIHSIFNKIGGNQINIQYNTNQHQNELIDDLSAYYSFLHRNQHADASLTVRKAKLNPVNMSMSGPSCLPNTWLDIIQDITHWIVGDH